MNCDKAKLFVFFIVDDSLHGV